VLGRPLHEVAYGTWDLTQFRSMLEALDGQSSELDGGTVEFALPNQPPRRFSLTGRVLPSLDEAGASLVLLGFGDGPPPPVSPRR
jgi:hypothetical protein